MKKYKHALIAIDTAIFTVKGGKLNVLLMRMAKKPFIGYWALPGRLVSADESLKSAAKKKLFENIKKDDIYTEQLYTFGDAGRDPFGRVVSTAYLALLPDHNLAKISEYKKWFPINKLPKLAYDHKEMITYGIKRIQAKLGYTNIVYSLLPDQFTLSRMQSYYEIILNKKLDKRNFRKKINSLKIVKNTGKKDYGMPNRPAELYKFIDKEYKLTEIL
ncbi:MAG: NUDIX domain-containing protein [bacterium]